MRGVFGKQGPCRTAFDSLLPPSALIGALGVGVKRRYRPPPSNSPQLSSNVIGVGVVRTALTRRRGSADMCGLPIDKTTRVANGFVLTGKDL